MCGSYWICIKQTVKEDGHDLYSDWPDDIEGSV